MPGIRTIALPDGETIPALGIGTWNMGDSSRTRADEIAALRTAVDLGMTVVDTAEMYGNGSSETLVADALADRRSEVFLVSKVLPQHATRRGTVAALPHALRALHADRRLGLALGADRAAAALAADVGLAVRMPVAAGGGVGGAGGGLGGAHGSTAFRRMASRTSTPTPPASSSHGREGLSERSS